MVNELDCPITAKVRCLGTDEETLDLCKAIENCGVSMLTVHGRTVDSNKLFVGPCDWEIIRKVKNSLSIPVIANGGISCREDALRYCRFHLLFRFYFDIYFLFYYNFYFLFHIHFNFYFIFHFNLILFFNIVSLHPPHLVARKECWRKIKSWKL